MRTFLIYNISIHSRIMRDKYVDIKKIYVSRDELNTIKKE